MNSEKKKVRKTRHVHATKDEYAVLRGGSCPQTERIRLTKIVHMQFTNSIIREPTKEEKHFFRAHTQLTTLEKSCLSAKLSPRKTRAHARTHTLAFCHLCIGTCAQEEGLILSDFIKLITTYSHPHLPTHFLPKSFSFT